MRPGPQGIIHRDIKPDNIGVQPDYTVKLFDWGEALLLDQLRSLTDKQLAKFAGIAGTPLYMPPEALLYLTKKGSTCSGSRGSTSSGSRSNDASSSTSKGCGQCGCCCWVATSSAHEHHQQQGTLRALTSPKLDVWGLGAVVYLLLAGKDILDSSYNLEDMAELLSASSGISLPAEVQASPAARDFVARVLEQDPAKRACARELLSHPWLSGLSAVRTKRAAALGSSKGPALSLSLQRSSSAQAMAYVIAAHRGGTRDSSSVPDTPVSGAEALSDSYE
jgi:serine/threonine protein kinase